MSQCETTEEELILYLFGELPPEESQRLEKHMTACSLCAGAFAELQNDLEALKAGKVEEPSLEEWAGVYGRIRQDLGITKLNDIQENNLWTSLRRQLSQIFETTADVLKSSWKKNVSVPLPVVVLLLLSLIGLLGFSLFDRLYYSQLLSALTHDAIQRSESSNPTIDSAQVYYSSSQSGRSVPFVLAPMGVREALNTIACEMAPVLFVPVPVVNPNVPDTEKKMGVEKDPSAL